MTPAVAAVDRVGEPRFDSRPQGDFDFIKDSQYVPDHITLDLEEDRPGNILFERAGPRRRIFFDPVFTTAAIVTCGGLCPGLNNVIRSLVLSLRHRYGVRRVLGIRYGYHSMNPEGG